MLENFICKKKKKIIFFIFQGQEYRNLYDKDQYFIEGSEGQYVTMIQQTSIKAVPVVRVIGFSKYLGHLNLTFDDHGKLLNYNGRPILLDHALPQGKERLKSRDNKIVWSLRGQNLSIFCGQFLYP